MLVAQLAFFFQRTINDVLEPGRQVGIQPDRRDRRPVHDAVKNYAGSFSAKGQRSGGHFVEHDSERKQVGAGVEWLASNLLGRHVSHGPQRRSRAGKVRVANSGSGCGFSHGG